MPPPNQRQLIITDSIEEVIFNLIPKPENVAASVRVLEAGPHIHGAWQTGLANAKIFLDGTEIADGFSFAVCVCFACTQMLQ